MNFNLSITLYIKNLKFKCKSFKECSKMDFRKIGPIFLVIFILGVSIIGTHSVYAAPTSEQHRSGILIQSCFLYAVFDLPFSQPFSKKIMNQLVRPRLLIESWLYVDGEWKSGELVDYVLYDYKHQKIAEDWDKTGIIIPATGVFDIKNLPIGTYTIEARYPGDIHQGWPQTTKEYTFDIDE